jgi:hypothetical protein
MTAGPGLRRTALLAVWRGAVWPVLAGTVTAIGLLGAWHLTGLLAVVLMVGGLWLLFAVTLYGVASESGLEPGAAARIGLQGAVAVVVLLGLADVFPRAGWVVALAVGVTAPAVADWTAPHLHRAAATAARRLQTLSSVDPDQDEVDKAFEEIVADLGNDTP